MNSFVDTVLRRRRAEGASGEQGKGMDKVYSNSLEGGGRARKSPKGKGKDNGDAGEDKHKQSKNAVSAEQALVALRRSRAPFISDESVIAPADNTTLIAGNTSSEDSVQITLEELPPAAGMCRLFGHHGWVAGVDAADEEPESGAGHVWFAGCRAARRRPWPAPKKQVGQQGASASKRVAHCSYAGEEG
jgi:hypothetical protein